mmetsp:Transcript_22986/g.28219  ORF Transcript_22986/g.28219 Transcript_22986/m.28219 type:complete len:437 (-) Transcript_22986:101-1411(-)
MIASNSHVTALYSMYTDSGSTVGRLETTGANTESDLSEDTASSGISLYTTEVGNKTKSFQPQSHQENTGHGKLNRVFARKKSSYQVFKEFFPRKENGEADASRILSKECFDEWVSSRIPRPQKPEEGFRSAITGHLAGTGRRQPFPADIEETLLRIVRKKQIWECFSGTKVSIGLYGSKTKGYHETRKASESTCNSNNGISNEIESDTINAEIPGSALVTLKRKRKRFRIKNHIAKREKPTDETNRFLVNLYCNAHNRYMETSSNSNVQRLNSWHEEITQNNGFDEILNINDTSTTKLTNCLKDHIDIYPIQKVVQKVVNQLNFLARSHPDSGAGRFSKSILQFYGRDIMTYMRRLLQHGADIPSAPLYHMLNLNPDNDERLKRSFLLPSGISGFYRNKIIGSFVLDKTMIIRESENAVPIFGETCTSKPLQSYSE